jgi:poly(3-hydroxybutyrate) depolymerase
MRQTNTFLFRRLAVGLTLALASTAHGAGRYLEFKYSAADKPGGLQLGVTYTLWLPDGGTALRGIIVHQHGCGSGACKAGATAAYDLHWQALARKWNCALLGPSYQQEDGQNCQLWCDPRNGSDKAFLQALRAFAEQSKHPELGRVPWCLWGHSGGGFWASLMQALHPERGVAIWLPNEWVARAWAKYVKTGDVRDSTSPAAAGWPSAGRPDSGRLAHGDNRTVYPMMIEGGSHPLAWAVSR